MVPETLGAILTFVVFIVPGVAFSMLRARHQPELEESTLRETSRIAMTSALFSVGALSFLALLRALGVPWIVDAGAWLKQGSAYAADHLGEMTFTLGVFLVVALALAWLADRLLRPPGPRTVNRPVTIWYSLFHLHLPPAARAWVHVRLKSDGTEMWGYVGDFSTSLSDEDPQIVLQRPLAYRRAEDYKKTYLPDWPFITIHGDDIAWMKVRYYTADSAKPGRVPAEPAFPNADAARKLAGPTPSNGAQPAPTPPLSPVAQRLV